MPSIKENLVWDEYHAWQQDGEEWSKPWGNTQKLWFYFILPRIKAFVPSQRVLEIAPGHGRITRFLKKISTDLFLVDLNKNCIDYCKKIFFFDKNIYYFQNNGKDLSQIKDSGIDFVFSWDSFVHMEVDVVENYIKEMSRTLRKDGAGFIHHSNLGMYPNAPITNWRAKTVDH